MIAASSSPAPHAPPSIGSESELAEVAGETPVPTKVVDADAHEGPVSVADEDGPVRHHRPRTRGTVRCPAPGAWPSSARCSRRPLSGRRRAALRRARAGQHGNTANGTTLDREGRPVICEQGAQRVLAGGARVEDYHSIGRCRRAGDGVRSEGRAGAARASRRTSAGGRPWRVRAVDRRWKGTRDGGWDDGGGGDQRGPGGPDGEPARGCAAPRPGGLRRRPPDLERDDRPAARADRPLRRGGRRDRRRALRPGAGAAGGGAAAAGTTSPAARCATGA